MYASTAFTGLKRLKREPVRSFPKVTPINGLRRQLLYRSSAWLLKRPEPCISSNNNLFPLKSSQQKGSHARAGRREGETRHSSCDDYSNVSMRGSLCVQHSARGTFKWITSPLPRLGPRLYLCSPCCEVVGLRGRLPLELSRNFPVRFLS